MKNKVFITGASGYLGSAIAIRLARAGHEVLGLTRRSEDAESLSRLGVRPVLGDLTKPESYIGVLKNCDAAVHAAYANGSDPAALDQLALEAFADASEDGRLRRFLYMSGVWVHGDPKGGVVDESLPLDPLELVAWRAAHEEVVMDLAQHEVAPIVFRPGLAYGESRGILNAWFREARDKGTITYPGDGTQHWALVHRDDVAEAYRLGLEHAASGDRFLLADGSALTVREIVEAIARVTGASPKAWPAEEVLSALGLYGRAMLVDERVNAAKARRELGWVPRHVSFVGEAETLYREWLGPSEARVP